MTAAEQVPSVQFVEVAVDVDVVDSLFAVTSADDFDVVAVVFGAGDRYSAFAFA